MTQPECLEDRLRKGDRELVRVPIVDHPVTTNESHAAVLGAAVGLVLGERGAALRTVLHEPWWAAGAFALAYALGRKLR